MAEKAFRLGDPCNLYPYSTDTPAAIVNPNSKKLNICNYFGVNTTCYLMANSHVCLAGLMGVMEVNSLSMVQ